MAGVHRACKGNTGQFIELESSPKHKTLQPYSLEALSQRLRV